MWFEKKPEKGELEELFKLKLNLLNQRQLFDCVAIDEGKVLGECEIARVDGQWKVGIIIGKEHRRMGLGGRLLRTCMNFAREENIEELIAELSEDNTDSILFFLTNGFYKDEKDTGLTKLGKRVLCYKRALVRKSVV